VGVGVLPRRVPAAVRAAEVYGGAVVCALTPPDLQLKGAWYS
jgi:hypothetical protein